MIYQIPGFKFAKCKENKFRHLPDKKSMKGKEMKNKE